MWRVVFVVLTVQIACQTSPPIPRQTSNNPTNGAKTVNKNAKNDQPPANASASVNQVKSEEKRDSADKPATVDKPQAVEISKFPAVSVSKDWADWGYWAFGGLLVLIGALQVWLVKRQADIMEQTRIESNQSSAGTLAVLNRQMAALESHVRAAEGTAAAAKESADAAKRSTDVLIGSERAWVVVETHSPALEPISPGAIQPYNTFRFALKNGGKTVAKLMELRGEAHLVQRSYTLRSPPEYAETPPPEYELGFRHGSVLVPGDTLEAWIEINLMLSATDIQAVRDSDKLLYVYGFLRYFDFAEKPRMLQFCYLYAETAISWTERGELSSTPQWLIAGPPDYNTHS